MSTESLPAEPCPFCGGEAEWRTSNLPDDFEIGCGSQNCGVTCFSFGKTAEEALTAWNRRAPTPPHVEQAGEPVADDVKWVVNDSYELGVRIGDQFFWLYKGESLVYEDGKHDDGSPIRFRAVAKREFGEVCVPEWFIRTNSSMTGSYEYHPRGLVYPLGSRVPTTDPEYQWQDLPAARAAHRPVDASTDKSEEKP